MSNESEVKLTTSIHQSLGHRYNRSFVAVFATIAVLVVINAALVLSADEGVSLERKLLGSASLWLILPTIWSYVRQNDFQIPFGPVLSALYLVYFVRGMFLTDASIRLIGFSEGQLIDAAWVAFLGMLGINLSLWIGMRPRVSRNIPRIDWPLETPTLASRFAMVSLLAPLLRLAVYVKGVLPEGLSMPLFILGQGIEALGLVVLIDTFQGKLEWRTSQWFVIVSIALSAIVSLGTGLASGPLWILFVPIMAYFSVKRKMPWALVLGIVVLFIPVLSFRHKFRENTGWQEYNLESSLQFFETVTTETNEKGIEWDELSTTTSDRFKMDGLLAHVVSKTPHEIPYWQGETYLPAFVLLIPRGLWPEKPSLDTGQQFGHRYGILDSNDWITSVNMAQIIEVYANFGIWAMVPLMFLIGMIEVFVWRLFDHPESSSVLRAIGVITLLSFLVIESSFSLVMGAKQIQIPVTLLIVAIVSGCGWSQLPRLRF